MTLQREAAAIAAKNEAEKQAADAADARAAAEATAAATKTRAENQIAAMQQKTAAYE
jgi:hypothetical protein